MKKYISNIAVLMWLIIFWGFAPAFAFDANDNPCAGLPSHGVLKAALRAVVNAGGNGGLNNDMWATVVNRDGVVCAVVFSGSNRGDQWPGSRIISAQKANTANAFSLPHGAGGVLQGLALSTGNLYSAVQPGGTLFGLQHSNPVDFQVAYRGNSTIYGQYNDPMVGLKIGGVNVFGGGLALYTNTGKLVGAIGVSGDTSCTDHIVAWKVRYALNLDNVQSGVNANTDNIIHDINLPNPSGFGHPTCDDTATSVVNALLVTHPVGPNP